MNEINRRAASLDQSAIEGRWAFVAACGAALLLVYVCTSASRRQSLFRLGASICAALGIFMVMQEILRHPQTALHIYPRKYFVASHVQSGRTLTMLLQDRRLPQSRNDKPQADAGFERFVRDYCVAEADTLLLCVTGPASMLTASRIVLQHDSSFPNKKFYIFATTLAYKGQQWFQALDSLQAHGFVPVNGQEYLHRDSTIILLHEQDLARLIWHPWQATLELERRTKQGAIKKAGIILPQVRCERDITFDKSGDF
jgi:hypothetical protein